MNLWTSSDTRYLAALGLGVLVVVYLVAANFGLVPGPLPSARGAERPSVFVPLVAEAHPPPPAAVQVLAEQFAAPQEPASVAAPRPVAAPAAGPAAPPAAPPPPLPPLPDPGATVSNLVETVGDTVGGFAAPVAGLLGGILGLL